MVVTWGATHQGMDELAYREGQAIFGVLKLNLKLQAVRKRNLEAKLEKIGSDILEK